jgi:hypothetical protein
MVAAFIAGEASISDSHNLVAQDMNHMRFCHVVRFLKIILGFPSKLKSFFARIFLVKL